MKRERASASRASVGRRAKSRRPDHGAAAVEFALVLPLFLMLVLGGLDWGYFFFAKQIVTNAAREGARTGTLVVPTPSCAAQAATAEANAHAAAQAYLTANGIGCTAVTERATCGATQSVQVTIRCPNSSLTGFTSIALPTVVYAQSQMRW